METITNGDTSEFLGTDISSTKKSELTGVNGGVSEEEMVAYSET
jgi:hypothetical protein